MVVFRLGGESATGDGEYDTCLWNDAAKKITATISAIGSSFVTAVAFAPGGRTRCRGGIPYNKPLECQRRDDYPIHRPFWPQDSKPLSCSVQAVPWQPVTLTARLTCETLLLVRSRYIYRSCE